MGYSKEKFYHALHQVESSGKENPPDGDKGKAIGPFQIWQVYWQDSSIGGDYQDVRKLDTAKRCVDGYMTRYAKKEWSDNMSLSDAEKCARIHNGGPQGHTKAATVGYWEKIKKHL